MNLASALKLQPGAMVALIGAGGKTTTMFRLAHELRDQGKKILVTTTTKIFKPSKPHVDRLFLVDDPSHLLDTCAPIQAPVIVAMGHHLEPGEKLTGLPPLWLDEFTAKKIFDAILVEADGAASHHLKIPSDHEPVVPSQASVTLWLMSVKVLGKPLTSEWVHRAEIAAELLGKPLGTTVTPEIIRRLVQHPNGCLKGIPQGSRRIAVINQADTAAEIAAAERLLPSMMTYGFDAALITSHADIQTGPLSPVVTKEGGD